MKVWIVMCYPPLRPPYPDRVFKRQDEAQRYCDRKEKENPGYRFYCSDNTLE